MIDWVTNKTVTKIIKKVKEKLQSMLPLSVIITTFNEEEHIEAVLKSVEWADEILLVDSFSTDDTVTLAKKYHPKIFQRKYISPADQKNWAIPQATHDWILILDADERVTPKLREEITSLLRVPPPKDAYWIPRQSFFMGKKVRFSGWQGDQVIRLIKKEKCRYQDVQVHEEIETAGIIVGKLKNKLHHFTYKNRDHFLAKMLRYAEWSAKDHFEKTPRVTFVHLYVKPFFRFVKHYVIQLGFLDGEVGFAISKIMAWGVYQRYLKIKELRKQDKR
ncbi:MAG: glycosyltransferase family 2 protein [Bacteroidota bacterium]